jgi:asparagine synthase (glutamine-hydrolysing)
MQNIILGTLNKNHFEKKKEFNESLEGCKHFQLTKIHIEDMEDCSLGMINRLAKTEDFHADKIYHYKNFTISGSIRLDDRNSLAKKIGIQNYDIETFNDAILICKAFEKWGEKCVNYIYGDWVFAIWDCNKNELFIARDHFGITGLYFFKTTKSFHFCTSISGINSISSFQKKINNKQILFLLSSIISDKENNIFEELQSLSPGHYLKIDQDLNIAITKYWNIEEIDNQYVSFEESLEEFNFLFKNAVTNRLSKNLNGSTLSGGLDSSSITTVAAEYLNLKNEKIIALTSAPSFDYQHYNIQNRILNESDSAKKVALMHENVNHKILDGKKYNIEQSIKLSHFIQKSPIHASSNIFWIYDMLDFLNENNIRNLIIGQNGNGTISWKGFQKSNLVRELMNIFYLKNKKNEYYEKIICNSFINKSFAKDLNLKSELNFYLDKKYHSSKDLNARIKIIKPYNPIIGRQWQENAYFFGINIYDPSTDYRLNKFLLGLPTSYYSDKTTNRKLIRHAMHGKLPQSIIQNKTRGLQGVDKVSKLISEMPFFENLTNEFESSNLIKQYLNVDKMKRILFEIKSKPYSNENLNKTSNLIRAFSVGMYLLNFNSKK